MNTNSQNSTSKKDKLYKLIALGLFLTSILGFILFSITNQIEIVYLTWIAGAGLGYCLNKLYFKKR